MPVRSLGSPVLTWPDRAVVERALRQWLPGALPAHPEVRRFGFFGSYARGTWGVGSDLDLIAIVDDDSVPAVSYERALTWSLERLPVPAEVVIYTSTEWELLTRTGSAFGAMIEREAVWVYRRA